MGANFPGDDLESLNWLPDHTDALQAKHWLPSKWSDFHSWIPYKKKADATNVASEKNHVEFIYFLLVFQKFIKNEIPLQLNFTHYFPRYLRGDIHGQRK